MSAAQQKHGKIAVGLFRVALAQRDAYDGAAAGAQHKADGAQQLRQRHDEVDRRKGRFAHKVGDAQPVHDAVDGGEQHGADAGQHEPQQAGIGKVVGQVGWRFFGMNIPFNSYCDREKPYPKVYSTSWQFLMPAAAYSSLVIS